MRLLVKILQFIIAIICYHYTKHSSKPKCISALRIWKWQKWKTYNDSVIMLRFGKKEVVKEEYYGAKKQYKFGILM